MVNIEQLHKIIERGEKLQRLMNNPDFKELILEGYLDKYANNLVHGLVTTRQPEMRKMLDDELMGISAFNYYLQMSQGEYERALDARDHVDSEEETE